MNREVGDLVEAQDAWARNATLFVEFISQSLDSTLGSGGEQLKVIGMFDKDHIALVCAGTVDDTVELQCPSRAAGHGGPSFESIISGGDIYKTTGFASSESTGEGGSQVRGLIGLCTIVEDIASFLACLGCVGSEWTHGAGQLTCDQRRHNGGESERNKTHIDNV